MNRRPAAPRPFAPWLPPVAGLLTLALGLLLLAGPGEARESPGRRADEQALALAVDALVESRLAAQGVKPAPQSSDAEFLRRLYLDVLGTVPTAEEVTSFLADGAPDKRARTIDALLASEAFAENEASWWYRTLTGLSSHARRPREGQGGRNLAGVAGETFHRWLSEQVAVGRPYDEMVFDLLTATGRTDENGATGYIARWEGNANNTAGAVAKHFLGVRIQCAQCHDHMYEPDWKQKDFQGMAAFFALTTPQRVPEYRELQRLQRELTRTEDGKKPDGNVLRRPRPKAGEGMEPDGMDGMDGDAMDPRAEKRGEIAKKLRDLRGYRNIVDVTDATADPRRLQRAKRFMNPERLKANPHLKERLELAAITPKFWMATESPDLPGISRRYLLARWVTAKENPYFARTLVNRLWGRFLGRGLVDPVDDFNSLSEPSHPELLDMLATDFVASGYDLRRLVRVLLGTETYQRTSRWDGDEQPDPALFAKAPVRPLTTEQIYFALVRATGLETQLSRASRRQGQQVQQAVFGAFSFVFDDDEGAEAEDFEGSIPQGLFLMNGELIQRAIGGRGGEGARRRGRFRGRGAQTLLQRVLREENKEGARVERLYLQAYGREPEAAERRVAQHFLKKNGGELPAYEDLFWALLNSAEFMTNH